jgi:hypothetical protein
LSPKGEFWKRLEQALDLSKTVSEQVKRDLGNSLLKTHPLRGIRQFKILRAVYPVPVGASLSAFGQKFPTMALQGVLK